MAIDGLIQVFSLVFGRTAPLGSPFEANVPEPFPMTGNRSSPSEMPRRR
jgi:hypothetical protein